MPTVKPPTLTVLQPLLLIAFCLLLAPPGMGQDETAAPEQVDTTSAMPSGMDTTRRGALLRIDGEINPLQHRYLERALAQAREAGVDVVVTHITSYGGRVDSCIAMVKLLLAQGSDRNGPRLVAYVDQQAISAAAAIAYAHEEVWLGPNANIGNIGVIFQTPDGQIAYAPEKYRTMVRSLLESIADARPWDRALLTKMTAREQILYQVRHQDGREAFVLANELDDYLKDKDDIDRDDPRQVVKFRHSGTTAEDGSDDYLLTLTTSQALELQMATGRIDDGIAALWAELGVDPATVLDITPTLQERIARVLAMIAPLFASLALLFIIFEIKTPGVGIWATLAAIFGVVFLVFQFWLDMVGQVELLLIGLGLILILVEVFTWVGAGFLAMGGGALLLAGVFLALIPTSFDPAGQAWGPVLSEALGQFSIVLGLLLLGLMLGAYLLPRSSLMRRLAVGFEIGGTGVDDGVPAADGMRGCIGTAVSMLRPGGSVRLEDGMEYSARSLNGAFIAAGSRIRVVGRALGELEVELLAAETAEHEHA